MSSGFLRVEARLEVSMMVGGVVFYFLFFLISRLGEDPARARFDSQLFQRVETWLVFKSPDAHPP